MKKFIALAVFALMAVTTVAAQGYTPPPVEISTRKAKIDGVMYYSHRVQDKQTLYSLCKAYHVTEQEIRDANGGLEKGLQAGTEILIPAKLETEQEDVEKVTAAEYNVPKVAENTSEVTQTESVDEEEEAKYRIHRVKWHENIYTISIKYKISVATIVKVNNLKSKRLTIGQRIKIPKGSYLEYVQQTDGMERDTIINGNEGIEDDQDAVENQENENDEDDNKGPATFDGKAKIALILPFSASTNTPSDNYLDFYSGFLMAVKNAKEMGRNIELNVIDITSVSDKSEIGRAYSLEDYNFVVGPVSTSDLKPVAEYCSNHKVPVISPMDQKAAPLVEDYKYLIQYTHGLIIS
ncbi:MAG: LysM peptidoglycan-binding domain-containing protein [Bacteroidales bacterium]|nr:LysM peptidoglycan-binding domain-containing protein [Bacteroidales bacterium]